MFQPDEFRTYFAKNNDFAKGSKFEVRIAPPQFMPNGPNYGKSYEFRFQCESAELPGITIDTVENRRYGIPEPIASKATYQDVRLSLICAGNMVEKKYFDNWLNYIIPRNNYHLRYKEDYATIIEIYQFSEIAEDPNNPSSGSLNSLLSTAEAVFPKISPIAEIGRNIANTLEERKRKPLVIDAEKQKAYLTTLYGAFPTIVDAIPMNWNDDGILRLNITIKYDYWDSSTTLDGVSEEIVDPLSNRSKSPTMNWKERIQKFAGGFNR